LLGMAEEERAPRRRRHLINQPGLLIYCRLPGEG
jgi:hypothetical protein